MMYEHECGAMWSRQQPGWVADISIRVDPTCPSFRLKHHLPAWLPRLEVFLACRSCRSCPAGLSSGCRIGHSYRLQSKSPREPRSTSSPQRSLTPRMVHAPITISREAYSVLGSFHGRKAVGSDMRIIRQDEHIELPKNTSIAHVASSSMDSQENTLEVHKNSKLRWQTRGSRLDV
ncbi:hypothetical protein IG631_03360 [Alternaria alternata]|nr:hypothetical protein IG631_03360 [Alternaria alternata]